MDKKVPHAKSFLWNQIREVIRNIGSKARMAPAGPTICEPEMIEENYITRDGLSLPLRCSIPSSQPKAVILALHGLLNYSSAFDISGSLWLEEGIATYAYDQRGFGANPNPGIFAGGDTFVSDAADMLALLKARYPDTPLYLLGQSMGGAIAALTTKNKSLGLSGTILVAPAMWGGRNMPFWERAVMRILNGICPAAPIIIPRAVWPTDDCAILQTLYKDNLTQKFVRIDFLSFFIRLMGEVYETAQSLGPGVLVLYGRHDQILPEARIAKFLNRLSGPRIAIYDDGYHMLLRDTQHEAKIRDIAAWIMDRTTALPSGADGNRPWYKHQEPDEIFYFE